jgi:hypothetical protein
MTHTLKGGQAPQAAARGAIRSSSAAPEAVHLRRVRTNGDRPSGHETGPTPGGPRRPSPKRLSRPQSTLRRNSYALATQGTAGPGAHRAGGAGAQGERAARACGIPAYGSHRADLLQVLVDAASDADLRTGQRVTVMVQHDWSGEFANQRIAELASRPTGGA